MHDAVFPCAWLPMCMFRLLVLPNTIGKKKQDKSEPTKRSKKMTLSDYYNTAAIAELYYKKVNPERKYTRKQAKDQFKQERNFNVKVLTEIITAVALNECKRINSILASKRKLL